MGDFKSKVRDAAIPPFERLVALLAVLRSDEGCPWDRKQTHRSLLPYLIEETYEVVEAVESGDYSQLREELGDLICQIVFHAQLAKEAGEFDIDDSIGCIIDKLIKRHPHVFEEKKQLSPKQVRDQWEKIKIESGEKESVLSGLPSSMPALTMAFRIGEKAGGVGFDWEKAEDVMEKIEEELDEIRREVLAVDRKKLSEEIGDLLFAIASLARQLDINPELSLRQALKKFRERFARMERHVNDSGKRLDELTLAELESIWQIVK